MQEELERTSLLIREVLKEQWICLLRSLKVKNSKLNSQCQISIELNQIQQLKILSKATIALVTSGGIVPKGNPDHIESSSASKYGKYDIEGFDRLNKCRP